MSNRGSQIARIIAESPPSELVPAAEAARQAAAAHVWRSAYEQGARAGWTAGWAAASSPSPTSSVDDPPIQLQMSEEYARLFSRPKPRQQETPQEEPEEFDLRTIGGGSAQQERLQQKSRLYGEQAEKVVESENMSNAIFRAEASRTGAPYWPVVPLRDT
ncbi:unnamed protein product [Agarophyton chilense]